MPVNIKQGNILFPCISTNWHISDLLDYKNLLFTKNEYDANFDNRYLEPKHVCFHNQYI